MAKFCFLFKNFFIFGCAGSFLLQGLISPAAKHRLWGTQASVGSAAPRYVETSETWDGTHCPCIDRQIFYIFKNIYIIIFILVALGLYCCTQTFSSCNRQGYSFNARASHCSGFSCCGAELLQHGLRSCRAWA